MSKQKYYYAVVHKVAVIAATPWAERCQQMAEALKKIQWLCATHIQNQSNIPGIWKCADEALSSWKDEGKGVNMPWIDIELNNIDTSNVSAEDH